jgi:hypothetical protein
MLRNTAGIGNKYTCSDPRGAMQGDSGYDHIGPPTEPRATAFYIYVYGATAKVL